MNKTNKIIIPSIIFSFAICAITCATEANVAELVKNHPLQAQFPLDESVVLYEGIQYNLDPDGKITKRVHIVRTMFTENSLDRFGDFFIPYYADKQELNVEICRAYMLDGKVVDTQANGFNPITVDACATPDFACFQEMVTTVCGLEWGGTEELLYTITDRVPFQPWLEGIEYFQSDEYIMWKEVEITTPENIPLKIEFLNGDGDMKLSVKDGKSTRLWTMKDVPHILRDDAYAYRMRFVPTLLFSTCQDWKQTGSYYAKIISDAGQNLDFLKKAADEVIKDRTEAYFIIEEMAKLVRNKIRTIDYNEPVFHWQHRPPERVLTTLYANSFEKALLFTALLKAEGLPAEIAVSAEIAPPDFDVPNLVNFDRFWVITEKNGEELFLDPLAKLSQQSRKDLAGQAVFRLNYTGAEPAKESYFEMSDNVIILNVKTKIKEDGAYSGSGYFRASGYFSPYFSATENSNGVCAWLEAELNNLLPNMMVSGSSTLLLSEKDCKFTFEFTGEKLGDAKEGYLSLKMPQPPINIKELEPNGFHPFYSEHENPVYFKGIGTQIMNLTFELPDGWSLAGAPENVQKESSIGSALIKVENKLNSVDISIQRSIKESEIYSDSFPILRNLYLVWEKNSNNFIALKVK